MTFIKKGRNALCAGGAMGLLLENRHDSPVR